jgi:large subunit ribosomal protein L2
MPVKRYKPTTNGRRFASVLTYEEVTKTSPEKQLTVRLKNRAGRNNQGCITIRHRGGGYKTLYRLVDFKQTDKLNIEATVQAIEYDPSRNAFIALVFFSDGEKRYILAPEGLKVGTKIRTALKTKVRVGNRMMLMNIPIGFDIYNIEVYKGKGGQLVRGAGTSAKLVGIDGDYAQVQLPSGENRLIQKECYASIGKVSNEDIKNVRLGKAGRNRLRGIRPRVLGKSMNPVDHPHGGGEGHSPIGLKHPKTPWGAPALGHKTRTNKRTSRFILKRRK